MKRYLIFGIWVGKTPSHREKYLSGVKFRSAKCPDVWTNQSGKATGYSRGCREMRLGLSAQSGFCGVQSTAQITPFIPFCFTGETNHGGNLNISPQNEKARCSTELLHLFCCVGLRQCRNSCFHSELETLLKALPLFLRRARSALLPSM